MALSPARLQVPRITRRGLLIGAALGGGLLVAWGLTPRRFPLPAEPHAGETAFNAWLRIDETGLVTVAVPQLEMGQGVSTVLAQIAAMELGADWAQVAAEPAPVSGAYANVPLAAKWSPLWLAFGAELGIEAPDSGGSRIARGWAERHRFTATADGTALAAYEQPLREAAGAVRTLLMQAAAARWGADWRACRVSGGVVSHGQQRARFGELAADAARYDPPGELPLGPAPAEPPRDAGSAWPRLDLPAKAEGRALFAGDVRLPGLVYAAIRHAPRGLAARLGAYDAARVGDPRVRLVKGPEEGPAWLAAVAPSWWLAERALTRLAPAFKVTGPADSQAIDVRLDKAVRKGRTYRMGTIGDPEGQIGEHPSLVARYDIAPGLHGGLETATCTVRLRAGQVDLWLASQAPEPARRAVAQALGINPRDVILYPVPAGGSFDARLEHDHAVEAALIARAVGKPVQLIWSRWQEHLAGKPRAPAAAVLWARTAPDDGAVLAWRT
ncbi:MAG TPA: molybdopterin cofactor-binding domain-containing protein, partial [Novosphingobium sp.]